MASLRACRSIGGLDIRRDDERRAILVADTLILFTPTEYLLFSCFLTSETVHDATLIEALYGQTQAERSLLKNMERHLEHIKGKLRPGGLYLRRVYRYGYSLVALSEETESVAS